MQDLLKYFCSLTRIFYLHPKICHHPPPQPYISYHNKTTGFHSKHLAIPSAPLPTPSTPHTPPHHLLPITMTTLCYIEASRIQPADARLTSNNAEEFCTSFTNALHNATRKYICCLDICEFEICINNKFQMVRINKSVFTCIIGSSRIKYESIRQSNQEVSN